jgi:hypothetical protein
MLTVKKKLLTESESPKSLNRSRSPAKNCLGKGELNSDRSLFAVCRDLLPPGLNRETDRPTRNGTAENCAIMD